jgi:DNA invertase Pin-like site-specific DNA recombinase
MTKIGYARVSTTDQDLTLQRKQLKKAGCKVIRSEKMTGTTRNGRKELETILDFIRKGDQLIVTKLDRLARDLLDLQLICQTIDEQGASLVVLDQNLDTSTAAGKAFFQMLGVFAEFETNIRRERQAAGIARAKAEGKYRGRKPTVKPQDVKNLADKGTKVADIAKELGCSRQAVYRVLEKQNA